MAEKIDVKIEDGLVVVEPLSVPAIFADEKNMLAIIDMIKTEVDKHEIDATSQKGRDAATSLAYKVTRSKTTLDALGKDQVADLKAKVKSVDSIRKIARDRLDALRDEIKAPVLEWEAAEEERVAKINKVMTKLSEAKDFTSGTVEEIIKLRETIQGIVIGDYLDEFVEKAHELKNNAIESLDQRIEKLRKEEEDRIELEKLRKEKAEREEADRRREEEKRAEERRLAEEKEKERREAEIRKQEREKVARDIKEAAERAEREKEAAVQAERRRIEEVKRVAEEKEMAERAAAEKKAANKRRQKRINHAAWEGISAVVSASLKDNGVDHSGLYEIIAEAVVQAIIEGEIPNVTINY